MSDDQPLTPPPTDSVEHIKSAVRQIFHSLLSSAIAPTPVLLAVSGGPDSLCMADAILALSAELGIVPLIAHLEHGLRGEASRDDAAFVSAFAAGRGVPCVIEHAEVARLAREKRLSIETAARAARYDFLARAAHATGAAYIALAHTADDQTETVLLRLLRGTGISGLRGMRSVTPLGTDTAEVAPRTVLVRPLLAVRREAVEAYCTARALAPRHDASNDEWRHIRNRVRHELLPLLETYNPGIRKVLLRLAETAAADMEIIDYATRQAYEAICAHDAAERFTYDRDLWRVLPAGLQRATLREAVRRFKGDLTDLKFAGVEEARDVLNSDARRAEIAILADVRIVVVHESFTLVGMG